jgi:Na+/H+-translocating membrane pyrophosphatase
VGERNYRWFLLFLLLNAVLMAYGVWASASVLAHKVITEKLLEVKFYRGAHPVESGSYWVVMQYLLGAYTEVCMVGVLCVVMGCIVLGFFLYHCSLVASNLTTNETFKWAGLAGEHARATAEYRRARAAQEDAQVALATALSAVPVSETAVALARERLLAASRPPMTLEESMSLKGGARSAPSKEEMWTLTEPGPMPVNRYDAGVWQNFKGVLAC